MSLYTVTIENRIYKVNISGEHCTVNGEEVDARVLPLNRNGLHVLHHGKQAYELFLSNQEADTYQMLMLGGKRIISQISSSVKKHLQASEECNAGCLSAPMHGLVVDVPVHEGDDVEKGQTLVVLESMKMQMQLRSPRPGKVTKVTVQPGSQVEKGALLVQFE
jgi:biotin carboxyl carrier protein